MPWAVLNDSWPSDACHGGPMEPPMTIKFYTQLGELLTHVQEQTNKQTHTLFHFLSLSFSVFLQHTKNMGFSGQSITCGWNPSVEFFILICILHIFLTTVHVSQFRSFRLHCYHKNFAWSNTLRFYSEVSRGTLQSPPTGTDNKVINPGYPQNASPCCHGNQSSFNMQPLNNCTRCDFYFVRKIMFSELCNQCILCCTIAWLNLPWKLSS